MTKTKTKHTSKKRPARRFKKSASRLPANPYIGESIQEFIAEERARDPLFASEFDRLALARRVREMREAREMRQADLAVIVHTTQSAIARLESGNVTPKLDLLQKIASAFKTRLEVTFVPEPKGA